MIIIGATIIISLSNINIISKANQAVEETNMATIADAAALKYFDIKTGAIEVPEPSSPWDIGLYIRYLLKQEEIIKEDQLILINNFGEIEMVHGKSNYNDGPWIMHPANYHPIHNPNPCIVGYDGILPENAIIPNIIDGKVVEDVSSLVSNPDSTSEVQKLRFSFGISVIHFIGEFPNLKEIYIPSTVPYIGENAFADCPQLEIIRIDKPKASLETDFVNPRCFPWGARPGVTIIWTDVTEQVEMER